jgi:hypothetical protein
MLDPNFTFTMLDAGVPIVASWKYTMEVPLKSHFGAMLARLLVREPGIQWQAPMAELHAGCGIR